MWAWQASTKTGDCASALQTTCERAIVEGTTRPGDVCIGVRTFCKSTSWSLARTRMQQSPHVDLSPVSFFFISRSGISYSVGECRRSAHGCIRNGRRHIEADGAESGTGYGLPRTPPP